MCQINLFNLLENNPTTGGSWTQTVNVGNSTLPIINNIIETGGANNGEYTFAYNVDNGSCSDSSTVTINIFNSINDVNIYPCKSNQSANVFVDIVDAYLLQYNINLIFNNSEWGLSYAAGSPTSTAIELSTGDYDPSVLSLNTQYNLLLTLFGSNGYCDCVTVINLEVVGCDNITLTIDDCIADYTSTCSNLPIDRIALQQFNGTDWDLISTTFPYTITDESSELYRIEIRYLIEYPFGSYYCYSYSNEVTYACLATLCADCSPYFTDVIQNQVGKLTCGNLVSPNCTVGNYVVDWYLNTGSVSTFQFTTGNSGNTDSSIEVFHPFLGFAGIPVIGGIYIPILRYVELNGILYSYNGYPNSTYSPDLETCLSTITVINPNCTNGIQANGYGHVISYTANTNFNNATRTVIYEYDVNTTLLAYMVSGISIADRFTFIHVDINNIETVLEDIVVGNDVSTTNTSSSPKQIKSQLNIKGIIELPLFSTGSYIKIEIVPSYFNPSNQNTSWSLYLKCLNGYDCSCSLLTSYSNGDITTACNPTACTQAVTIQLVNSCNLQYVGSNFISAAVLTANNGVTFCGYGGAADPCKTITGQVTSNKTSNLLTIQYTSNTEYLLVKNTWLSNYITPQCTDNSLPSYYTYYRVDIQTGDQCGDNNPVLNLFVHTCNVPSFSDSTNTISINLSSITNSFIDDGCSNCYDLIQNAVTNINNSFNLPNFNYTKSIASTKVLNNTPLSVSIYPDVLTVNKTHTIQYYPDLIADSVLNGCDIFDCSSAGVNGISILTTLNYRVEVTNATDICNNFKVLIKQPNGSGCIVGTTPYTLFYEIENSIQIFP